MLCVDQECVLSDELVDAVTLLIGADLWLFERSDKIQLEIARRWDEVRIGTHAVDHLPRIYWLCRDLQADVWHTKTRFQCDKKKALAIIERVIDQLAEEVHTLRRYATREALPMKSGVKPPHSKGKVT